MNMLEAESAATAVDSMEVLNRRTSLLEIMAARIPNYIEKFFEDYRDGDGYQKLLDFVHTRINLLRNTQLPTQNTEVEQRQHPTDHPLQPPFEGCMYCKNRHDTSRCDKLYCLSLKDRVAAIATLHLCYHCLRPGHNAKSCPERREVVCSICNRKGHVTLLHGRHLLHSPIDSPSRHRRNTDDDAKSDVESTEETNETEGENELQI